MKHTWTAAEQELAFSKRQRTRWYLAIHKPQTLAHFEINVTPVDHPVSAVDVTEISGATFVDEGHTAWVGTAQGLSDLGRVRVRTAYTGPNINLMESGSGLIRWNEATHITVVDEHRPWVKHPRYDTAASEWRMDYDIGHANQLIEYPPMAVMGAPFVGILDSGGNISASFVGSDSIGFDSAISTYTWEFPDGSNSATAGTPTAPLVKSFSGASKNGNYVKLTVVDGNVASHTGYRLIFAYDNVADLPRVAFTSITGGPLVGGYTTQIHAYGLDDLDLAPGTEIIIFESASYGDTACAMGGNSHFRNNIVFRGWTTDEQIIQSPDTGMTIINAQTIDGIMANQPSYDVFYAQASPVPSGSQWVATYNLSMDRVAMNLMRWRSTVGDICDFYPGSGNAMSTKLLYQNLPRADWWTQLRSNYFERGMFWNVSSDMQSAIHSSEDPNITGGSGGMTAFSGFTGSNLAGQVTIERSYHEPVAQIQLYAVASVTPLGAESPGNVFGYYGGKVEHTQGLAVNTQDELITWAGNLRAKRNAEFKRVTTPLAGNIKLDPVPFSLVPLTMAASQNARRLVWTNKLFIPQELTITYQFGAGAQTTLVSEEVVNGKGGSAITFPTIVPLAPPTPPSPPTPPGPSVGSDVVYVMGQNYLGRTRNFGDPNPVYDGNLGPSETIFYDFILDPWDPKNKAYLSTSNGLYKTTNLDSLSPSWSLVLSKATIESTIGIDQFRDAYKISASINKKDYVAYFFIVGGNTETPELHCASSTDGGDNFTIVLVDTVNNTYAWGGAADYVPHLNSNGDVTLFAVTSDETGSPVQTKSVMRRSFNGGLTWATMGDITSFSVTTEVPYSAHCPYDGNEDGLIVYATIEGNSYKSTNAGVSWTALGIAPQDGIHRHNIETYTQDNQQLFIWDSADDLRVSFNAGTSFETRGSVPGNIKAGGGFPFDKERYYAVSNTGIYLSTDGGNNFQDKTGNFPVSELSPTASDARAVIVPLWVE